MWPLSSYKQPFNTVYLNVSVGNVSRGEGGGWGGHMVTPAGWEKLSDPSAAGGI